MKLQILLTTALSLILHLFLYSPLADAETNNSLEHQGQIYNYTVEQSGDNFHFEFDKPPATLNEQYTISEHVLKSIYQDNSIDSATRKNYVRERAKCTMFSGALYDYTFCILPDEFKADKNPKFEGFVTQLPNWKWMIIWIVFPIILIIGIILALSKIKKTPAQSAT